MAYRLDCNIGDFTDLSLWWKVNSSKYPILFKLARDILGMPATSCATERVFSQSRHVLGDYRNSLSLNLFENTFLKVNGMGDPSNFLKS